MVRENNSQLENAYSDTDIKKRKGLIVTVVLLLVIVCIIWLISQLDVIPINRVVVGWISIAGIGILACLLTIVIERLLLLIQPDMRIRYRMSFMISTGIGWSFLIYLIISDGIRNALSPVIFGFILLMLWVLVCALLGGLIVTAYQVGLVENNFPPSEEVASIVYEQHVRLLDSPVRISISKRVFDVLLSAIGLCLSMPVWTIAALVIWLEDPGALLFVKNSVGRRGKNFQQYKFRTMIHGAEEGTGPIMAMEGDQRVLHIGKLLRKTALDELPQLINILKGEMSFVGPRPQRTVMVFEYLKVMPEYATRHLVLPGLAGLAQVVGDYYLTPRQKLRFDRIYIRHANLGFDMLLVLLAFMITFWYRWQKDWDGRLPRWILHGKSGS